jgi:hypothetical protein
MDTGNSFGGGSPEINKVNQERAPIPGAYTGFEKLPQPQGIETPIVAGKETEQGIIQGETQPVVTSQSTLPTQRSQQSSSATQPAVSAGELPKIASHANRIEKTWIERGENIFTETRDDPYNQKIQVDGLKDEYIAARYGGEEDAA